MKNFILICFFLLAGKIAAAQTNIFPTTGNAGIGTASPVTLFDIRGAKPSGSYWHLNIHDLSSAAAGLGGGISFGGYKYGTSSFGLYAAIAGIKENSTAGDEAGAFIIKTTTDASSGFGERLRITSAGKVGIGTNDPTSLLHILASRAAQTIHGTGDHATLNLIAASNSGGGVPSVYLSRGADNLYGALIVERGTAWGNQPVFSGADANDVVLGSKAAVPLKFGVNGNIKMKIDTAGNVAIGTSAANGYRLAVNGHIRAKEIKVETGWADFVFKPDYKLRSLAETEQFITKNGHLPEIPSAKEVEKDGINVGEMNAKLLQKIEELTLYLIELNKTVERQQLKIEMLEN